MNQPPPPDSDPQLSTSEPSIRQQAEHSPMGGGMQAAQGDRIIQNQGNNNWLGNVFNFFIESHTKLEKKRILLTKVKGEVEELLGRFLLTKPINLQKELQPQQVKPFLSASVKIGEKPISVQPDGINILKVFDQKEIAGKVLILGAPGSGKTTTQLELAQALIAYAETNLNDKAIPVLINLSLWKNDSQTLTEWLLDELWSKYGVGNDLGKEWLKDCQIIPMLDYLDELKPAKQGACIQGINKLLAEN